MKKIIRLNKNDRAEFFGYYDSSFKNLLKGEKYIILQINQCHYINTDDHKNKKTKLIKQLKVMSKWCNATIRRLKY